VISQQHFTKYLKRCLAIPDPSASSSKPTDLADACSWLDTYRAAVSELVGDFWVVTSNMPPPPVDVRADVATLLSHVDPDAVLELSGSENGPREHDASLDDIALDDSIDHSDSEWIVGCVGLQPLPVEVSGQNVGELRRMNVHPALRRRGLAQALIDALCTHARLHQFTHVKLCLWTHQVIHSFLVFNRVFISHFSLTSIDQLPAVALYESMGFIRVGERSVGQSFSASIGSAVDVRVYDYVLDLNAHQLVESPPPETVEAIEEQLSTNISQNTSTVSSQTTTRHRSIDFARVQDTTRPAKSIMASQIRTLLRHGHALCSTLIPTAASVSALSRPTSMISVPSAVSTNASNTASSVVSSSRNIIQLSVELDLFLNSQKHIEGSERALSQIKSKLEQADKLMRGDLKAKLATLNYVNDLFQ
jgi:ribosomal protein S18 acetylase RimI-like enzyme